jgi:Acetyltransferase (GNAT) domain
MTLFNEDRFHALNLRDSQRVVCAEIHDAAGRLVGSLGGVLDGETLTCGHSAPFGGVDFARERETPANVALVIDTALPQLHAEGARTLRIRLPPACYGESEPLVQFTLLNRGFAVERCELNQHIELDALSGPDAYIEQLKSPARRALRGLLEQDLAFVRCESAAEWEQAYATLAQNRASRGRELSLSLEYVQRAREALGDAVRMYALTQAGGVIAAALVYRVRPQRDLVVAWGDGEHGLEHSPMNLLAHRVVESALEQGVRTLDLGISNEPEPDASGALVANPGLVQFKQSVLARAQPRFTLVRELSP